MTQKPMTSVDTGLADNESSLVNVYQTGDTDSEPIARVNPPHAIVYRHHGTDYPLVEWFWTNTVVILNKDQFGTGKDPVALATDRERIDRLFAGLNVALARSSKEISVIKAETEDSLTFQESVFLNTSHNNYHKALEHLEIAQMYATKASETAQESMPESSVNRPTE